MLISDIKSNGLTIIDPSCLTTLLVLLCLSCDVSEFILLISDLNVAQSICSCFWMVLSIGWTSSWFFLNNFLNILDCLGFLSWKTVSITSDVLSGSSSWRSSTEIWLRPNWLACKSFSYLCLRNEPALVALNSDKFKTSLCNDLMEFFNSSCFKDNLRYASSSTTPWEFVDILKSSASNGTRGVGLLKWSSFT